jgi:hypothetical protein
MDQIRDTTARLRRTFHYPTDESSNDSPEVMDEEGESSYYQHGSALYFSGAPLFTKSWSFALHQRRQHQRKKKKKKEKITERKRKEREINKENK